MSSLAYFDVAAESARRERDAIARMADRVRREWIDPTDLAHHNAHDTILTMQRALDETISPDRCVQLEERADELVALFCSIKEQARDKAIALTSGGLA